MKNVNATNKEVCIALIGLYRSITVESLEIALDKSESGLHALSYILRDLTGFGWSNTCTLCTAVKDYITFQIVCSKCIHFDCLESSRISHCLIHPTYEEICQACQAGDINRLVSALQARADYLETLIED